MIPANPAALSFGLRSCVALASAWNAAGSVFISAMSTCRLLLAISLDSSGTMLFINLSATSFCLSTWNPIPLVITLPSSSLVTSCIRFPRTFLFFLISAAVKVPFTRPSKVSLSIEATKNAPGTLVCDPGIGIPIRITRFFVPGIYLSSTCKNRFRITSNSPGSNVLSPTRSTSSLYAAGSLDFANSSNVLVCSASFSFAVDTTCDLHSPLEFLAKTTTCPYGRFSDFVL